MAALTLKNIPEELLEKLRLLAERDRRSLTQEILYILEHAVAGGRGQRALQRQDKSERVV